MKTKIYAISFFLVSISVSGLYGARDAQYWIGNYKSASPALREARGIKSKMDALDGKLTDEQKTLRDLWKQRDSMYEHSQTISDSMGQLSDMQSKMVKGVSKEVLKIMMRLFVETGKAMTSRSATDLAVGFTEEAYKKLTEAETKNKPAVVQWARIREQCASSVSEMRSQQEKLNKDLEEINEKTYAQEEKVRQLESERKELELKYKQKMRDFDDAFNAYMRGMSDDLSEETDNTEKAIESAVKQADKAAKSSSPNFAPFITLHRKLANALISNTLSGGSRFDSRWNDIAADASRHYSSCESKKEGSAGAAYANYKSAAASIKAEVESKKQQALSQLRNYENSINGIDTSFVDNFEMTVSNYNKSLSASRQDFSAQDAETSGLSISEIEKKRDAASEAAGRLSKLSVYLESAYAGFNESYKKADEKFTDTSTEYRVYREASSAMIQYADYSVPDTVSKKGAGIRAAGAYLLTGILSSTERGRIASSAVELENYAGYLDRQVELNKEYISAAGSYTTLASSLSRNAEKAEKYYDGDLKELYELSDAAIWWEKYYQKYMDEDDRFAELTRKRSSKLREFTVTGHLEQIKKAEDTLSEMRDMEKSYFALDAAKTRVNDASGDLRIYSREAMTPKENVAKVAHVLDGYRVFHYNADRYMGVLTEYIRIAGGFGDLENTVYSFYSNYYNTVKSAMDKVSSDPDKLKYVGQYWDKRGVFLGFSSSKEKYKMDGLRLPFFSEKIYGISNKASNLESGFASLGSEIREKYFTGPRVLYMMLGSKKIEEGFAYGVVEFDKEELTDGEIIIRGRLDIPGSPAKSVLVSLDGGSSYTRKAELTDSRNFIYRLKPNRGEIYRIKLKAVDERDNEGEPFPWTSHIKVRYTGVSHEEDIREYFSQLASDYTSEIRQVFMRNISFDYRGRYENLDRAIELDFRYFDSIDIKFYVDKVVVSRSKTEAAVDVHWRRSWTEADTGKRLRDEGENLFKLKKDEGNWKLYAYSGTPIFGMAVDLSIASPMVSGRISGQDEDQTITRLPVHRGQVLGNHWTGDDIGFAFTTGRVIRNFNFDVIDLFFVGPPDAVRGPDVGGGIYRYGKVPIESVVTAPVTGYVNEEDALVGHVYIVECANGNYAKFRITAIDTSPDKFNNSTSMTFDWVYQPDGSRDLR